MIRDTPSPRDDRASRRERGGRIRALLVRAPTAATIDDAILEPSPLAIAGAFAIAVPVLILTVAGPCPPLL